MLSTFPARRNEQPAGVEPRPDVLPWRREPLSDLASLLRHIALSGRSRSRNCLTEVVLVLGEASPALFVTRLPALPVRILACAKPCQFNWLDNRKCIVEFELNLDGLLFRRYNNSFMSIVSAICQSLKSWIALTGANLKTSA